MLLSSAHQGWRDPATGTLTRKVVDEETGRLKKREIPAPPHAMDYTVNMGGVDRGDQLRSYYTCARKSQIWWRAILYFLIDVAQVNAWISYKHHHSTNKETTDTSSSEAEPGTIQAGRSTSHAKFVLDVATGLIDGYAGGSDTMRQFRQIHPVPSTNIAGHYSTKMPGKNARWCRWCRKQNIRTSSGLPKSTRRGCPVCGVNLCPGDCFINFHSALAQVPSTEATSSN